MHFVAKHWIRGLFAIGGGLLFYAFAFDVTQAGGFSWDDPPELTEPYLPQIAVAENLYLSGWIVLGIAVSAYCLRGLYRIVASGSRVPDP
jgi:hypothetical protein